MSPLPGVEITVRDSAPPRSSLTDTAGAFMVGLVQKGSIIKAVTVRSMVEFEDVFGVRQSFGLVYDAAETFFREGGNKLTVSRIVGPAPVSATANMVGSAGTSMVATATSPGEWANGYKVKSSTATGGFR